MHDTDNEQPSSVSQGASASHQAKRARPQPREDQIARSQRPILVAPSRVRGVVEKLATLSLLGIFSFLGLLIRLGLSALMAYGGQPVFPLLWAQVVGCAVMGVVSTRRSHLEQIWLPLYAGLATGLPGSITTFSSWMRDVFQAFAHIESVPRGRFYDFLDGLTQTVMTLAASMGAFVFGVHLATLLFPERLLLHLQRRSKAAGSPAPAPEKGHRQPLPEADHPPPHGLLDRLSVLVFILLWLAACLISYYVERWRGIVMFSLVLAPLGTWTRFYLSQLNLRIARFPLGTFLANMLGTALLALCVALQTTGNRTRLQCQILQGFDDGFCGCLTTVSTLVAEIRKLNRKDAYVYAVASWAAGQVVVLLILGSTSFARQDGLQPRCAL